MAGYSVASENDTEVTQYDTTTTEVSLEPDSVSDTSSSSSYATYNGDFKEKFRLVSTSLKILYSIIECLRKVKNHC